MILQVNFFCSQILRKILQYCARFCKIQDFIFSKLCNKLAKNITCASLCNMAHDFASKFFCSQTLREILQYCTRFCKIQDLIFSKLFNKLCKVRNLRKFMQVNLFLFKFYARFCNIAQDFERFKI